LAIFHSFGIRCVLTVLYRSLFQVPTQNALFFVGDHVDGKGDDLIEKLNTGGGIAATLLPKLDPGSNLFIVYPSAYQDQIWARYSSMLPETTSTGEPVSFDGRDPVAARQLAALLEDALRQLSASRQCAEKADGDTSSQDQVQAAKQAARKPTGTSVVKREESRSIADSSGEGVSAHGDASQRTAGSHENIVPVAVRRSAPLPTFVMGFSKGGVVLNELLAEMAALEERRGASSPGGTAAPQQAAGLDTGPSITNPSLEHSDGATAFLESISEIHCIDVGLIRPGAYLTDPQKLSSVVRRGGRRPLVIGLHGTPRQWAEKKRPFIGEEKDRMLATLQAAAASTAGDPSGFHVFQRGYCEGQKVGMRMHFEIIDLVNFSLLDC
jgi:hypothetical protein